MFRERGWLAGLEEGIVGSFGGGRVVSGLREGVF